MYDSSDPFTVCVEMVKPDHHSLYKLDAHLPAGLSVTEHWRQPTLAKICRQAFDHFDGLKLFNLVVRRARREQRIVVAFARAVLHSPYNQTGN